jgi:hypothetical protein
VIAIETSAGCFKGTRISKVPPSAIAADPIAVPAASSTCA